MVPITHLLRDKRVRVLQVEDGCGNRGDGKDGAVGGGAGVAKGAGTSAGARPNHGAHFAQLCTDKGKYAGADLGRRSRVRPFVAWQMLHKKRQQRARIFGVRVQELQLLCEGFDVTLLII